MTILFNLVTRNLPVWDKPVDGWKVFTLGQFLVKTPKHLNDAQCGGSYRIWEITTRGRYGTDNWDRALTFRTTLAFDTASTLVERSQTSAQVCGITTIESHSKSKLQIMMTRKHVEKENKPVGRHLSETTGNLTKSLGPTWCRISHHGDVVTHVTEVFRQCDT